MHVNHDYFPCTKQDISEERGCAAVIGYDVWGLTCDCSAPVLGKSCSVCDSIVQLQRVEDVEKNTIGRGAWFVFTSYHRVTSWQDARDFVRRLPGSGCINPHAAPRLLMIQLEISVDNHRALANAHVHVSFKLKCEKL